MSIVKYFDELNEFIKQMKVKDIAGQGVSFEEGAERAIEIILRRRRQEKKLMFIGNGGSAAIASHMAVDFWRNGGIKALAFNEGPLLTCISNDYGYEHVFEKPVEMFADPGDILVAISSSGRSESILNGARAARSKQCYLITLSGFLPDNPLSTIGDLNFYVPSRAYGQIEIMHGAVCHYLLDMIIERGKC